MHAKFLFFFSSRRRHTRCSRDWSSDVCSSDLIDTTQIVSLELRARMHAPAQKAAAKRPIGQNAETRVAGIRQHIALDSSFEEVIWGLDRMKGSDGSELLHLLR